MGCLGNSWQICHGLGWSSLVMFWWGTAHLVQQRRKGQGGAWQRQLLLSDLIHQLLGREPVHVQKNLGTNYPLAGEVTDGNKARRRINLESRPRQQLIRRPLRMNQRIQCAPKCLRNKGFWTKGFWPNSSGLWFQPFFKVRTMIFHAVSFSGCENLLVGEMTSSDRPSVVSKQFW